MSSRRWQDLRIVVYLKKDERLAEYIKIKDKYLSQASETGLSKEEK